VDDDLGLLAATRRGLQGRFLLDVASSGEDGLAAIRTQGPYAVLVVDMQMPRMNGVEFLERAQELAPDSVRIMLTGDEEQRTAVEAVNRGHVFRFLDKPCSPEELVVTLEIGLKHFEMQQMERELLEGTVAGSVKMLADVLGMVAPEALGRGQKLRDCVREFSAFIGAKPGWELEIAALLSSIGSTALPPNLLHKICAGHDLGFDEKKIAQQCPQVGHDLIADIPRLSGVADIVLCQNKGYDGSGLPADGRSGQSIPLGARMLKILGDRLDLEKDGISHRHAYDMMKAKAALYDPALLDDCFKCFADYLTHSVSADRPVYSLSVDDLEPGHVVVSDIVTMEGSVLISAGNRLTDMILRRLRNHDALGEVRHPILVQDAAMSAGVHVDAA
jgi:response regulator RpfG family c-di-GMP phosphodiesterase